MLQTGAMPEKASPALAFIIALAACDKSGTTAARTNERISSAALPHESSTGFLDGYTVRVARDGNLLWNGAPVNEATFHEYLRQFAAMPIGAGRLFVIFERGVTAPRMASVRQHVRDSGLCEQERCAEIEWNVGRPVVN